MLHFVLIKFAAIVLSHTSIIYGLKFLESPEEFLILPEDSDLSLTCTADSEEAVINWYFQQTKDGKRWFIFEAETLEYPSVQTSYEGFYSCDAVLGEDIIQSNVTDVRIAYIETRFLKVPSQVYTVEGSSVEFECEPPPSYPPAKVTWHKDNVPISNTRTFVTVNYTLTIVGTLPEDSGNYQCVALNEITGTERRSLEGELYVTQRTDNEVEDNSEKPEPSIASYFIRVNEGESTSLLCAFQGVPYPTYSWLFGNGTEVNGTDERFLYQYEKQVLQIIKATRDMTGVFQCVGENVAGNSTIDVTLFVYYIEELGFAEDLVEVLSLNQDEDTVSSIECQGLGTPPLTIEWYAEDGSLLSDSPILTIDTSVVQNTTAECRISNVDGVMSQTTTIEVEGSPTVDDVTAIVQCYTDKMTLTLSDINDVESYHLLDHECTFSGDEVGIDTPLNSCGTRSYYNETHIVYKNILFGVTRGSENDVISRGDGNFEIAYECSYMKTGNTDDIAWEARGHVRVAVKGIGEFAFALDLFNDDSFEEKFNSSQYPVMLSLKDNIYLEVSLITTDDNLSLLVSDVKASDSPSGEEGSFSYSLVQNGCIVDSTFEYIQMEDPKTKRFTLKAFHFMSSDSVVYLHAFVKICNASIENCSQSCTVNKRSLRAAETSEKYHIFQGPFVTELLGGSARVVSGSSKRQPSSVIVMVVLILITMNIST